VQAVNPTGSVEAKPRGGNTRSRHVEASRQVVWGAVLAQSDIS
jgi:hypothetical protein